MKVPITFEAKVKKSKSPISKTIKALDINYPNESLGFLHAIYAKVDGETPNKNKVILAKTVKNDVPQLKFTQANINHKRAGFVIGTILNAWVNSETDEIEIVFSFYKSLYPKQWETVEKAIEEGQMSVSFELMVENEDIVQMAGGVRKLKQVTFDGVGLLFPGVQPAYPDAKVLESANTIISNVFDNKTLLCASVKEAVNKIEIMLAKITKGKNKMDKKLKDALLAKFKEEVTVELGEEVVKDWSEEQWEAELEKRASTEDKKSEEEKAKEDKKSEEEKAKEDKKSEDEKAKKSVTKIDEKVEQEITYDDETNEEVIKTKSKRTVERDGKKVVVEEIDREVVYNYAQMEEVKAEHEKAIKVKDEEIKFLKENAKKVVEIRTELGDFVKDLADSDLLDDKKLENARLKKEVHDLKNKDVINANDESDENLLTGNRDTENAEDEGETSEDRVSNLLKARYGSN